MRSHGSGGGGRSVKSYIYIMIEGSMKAVRREVRAQGGVVLK